MSRFQNIKLVNSPSQPNEFSNSTVTRKSYESNRLFYESGVRANNNPSVGNLSLARSGVYSVSNLQQSTVRGGISRGIGNLPEERINKIAKDFVTMYGNGSEISSNSLLRMQKEAYDKASQKP